MHTFLQKQRLRTCITKRSKMLEQGLEKFDAVETLTDLQRKKLVFFFQTRVCILMTFL